MTRGLWRGAVSVGDVQHDGHRVTRPAHRIEAVWRVTNQLVEREAKCTLTARSAPDGYTGRVRCNLASSLQIAGQLGADDAGGGFGVGDDRGQLTRAERRRGHDRNRADALDGQPRRDEPGIVRESKD